MANTVNVDFITKVVEIQVNDNEAESLAAQAAINAAARADEAKDLVVDSVDETLTTIDAKKDEVEAELDSYTDGKKSEIDTYIQETAEDVVQSYVDDASGYAADAASQALSTQSVAASLTTFLETKETLTAPAVDAGLAITGAAADAKVTGDKIIPTIALGSAILSPVFSAGKGISSAGAIFPSAKRIATEEFINVSDCSEISYTITTGYRIYIAFYSEASEANKTRVMGWLTENGSEQLQTTDKYIRLCYASVGDASTLTPTDADKATVSTTNNLVFTMNNRALVHRARILPSCDLNDVTNIGVYQLHTGNTYTNRPSTGNDTFGGTMFVLPAYSQDSNRIYAPRLQQVVFSAYNKNIWMRYSGTGYDWRDWVSVANTAIVTTTKWLAIGDSITKGVYSDGEGTHDGTYGWVGKLSDSFGYTVLNKGTRGMGYIAVGGNGITFESVLQECEALAEDYNLVTVALGINDYNTSTITLAALEDVIDDAIQRLATKFPAARLVFITPFNSNRRGDVSSKYCCNYEYGGRSLKDIADLIQERCDAFGVECINATEQFLFNVYNMSTLLPDDTHPSIDGHNLIAKTMAHLLQF